MTNTQLQKYPVRVFETREAMLEHFRSRVKEYAGQPDKETILRMLKEVLSTLERDERRCSIFLNGTILYVCERL